MTLKEIRNNLRISLIEASNTTGIPLRTYIRYESDDNYGNNLKRKAMIDLLIQNYQVTINKGFISLDFIEKNIEKIFIKYDNKIDFCYLYGDYIKNERLENGVIELCIDSTLNREEEKELFDKLKEILIKRVNIINIKEAIKDDKLLSRIMKEGKKIYG